MLDVSTTGLRARSLVSLPKGAELDARVRFEDGNEVPVRVAVVWGESVPAVPGQYEFGLELAHVPQAWLDALAHLFATA